MLRASDSLRDRERHDHSTCLLLLLLTLWSFLLLLLLLSLLLSRRLIKIVPISGRIDILQTREKMYNKWQASSTLSNVRAMQCDMPAR